VGIPPAQTDAPTHRIKGECVFHNLQDPNTETFMVVSAVAVLALAAAVVAEKWMGRDSEIKTFLKIVLWTLAIYCTVWTISVPHELVAAEVAN